MSDPHALQALLDKGMDNAMLRFGLGQAWLKQGDAVQALAHLQCAIAHQEDYTAAWKLMAKALTELGKREAAIHAYQQGIKHAEKNGDQQALKEMNIFLKRLGPNGTP